jgi:hypothetical protein
VTDDLELQRVRDLVSENKLVVKVPWNDGHKKRIQKEATLLAALAAGGSESNYATRLSEPRKSRKGGRNHIPTLHMNGRAPAVARASYPLSARGVLLLSPCGEPLDDVARGQLTADGRRSLARVVVLGVGRALLWAHCNRIYHRDVRPANVVLRDSRSVAVLIDWGCARRTEMGGASDRAWYCAVRAYAHPDVLARVPPADTESTPAEHDLAQLAFTLSFVLSGGSTPRLDPKARIQALQMVRKFVEALKKELKEEEKEDAVDALLGLLDKIT